MREQRRDPTTGAWCVLSSERGGRPLYAEPARGPWLPREACPFCPGHEHFTTPTIATIDGPEGWRVRAFANLYPAVRVEGAPWARAAGPFDQRDGVGAHEVIVESPLHDVHVCDQPGQTALALRMARDRLRDLSRDTRLVHLMWFRNRGAMSGASQPHPHAQVLGSTAVPMLVQAMADRCAAHEARTGRALLDDVARWEEEQQARWLGRFGGVVAFTAYAPRFAFETWIVPDDGGPRFRDASDALVDDLGRALEVVLRAVRGALDDPSYNVLLVEAPAGAERGFRWHLRVTPRMVALGGFELAGGGTIVHTSPEEAAEVLRDAARRA